LRNLKNQLQLFPVPQLPETEGRKLIKENDRESNSIVIEG